MKSVLRLAMFWSAICFMVWASSAAAMAQSSGAACTREALKSVTDKYFTALEAHNPSGLPLASTVKYTENGNEVKAGKGFWETAGKTLLKRSLMDTQKCGTHSNTVMEENGKPILFGVRLKLDKDQITEIETVIAREKDFAFKPQGILDTKGQDWESILPLEQRSSRLAMIAAADDYYDMFAKEPKVRTPFATPCDRWENGTQTTVKMSGVDVPELANMVEHDCSPKGLVITTHGPRRFLVDVETGAVVAYVLFAGGLPDFHMFKMRNGKVELIQAVIGPGAKSMGWPDEPICK